jgi:hypothetical protein
MNTAPYHRGGNQDGLGESLLGKKCNGRRI